MKKWLLIVAAIGLGILPYSLAFAAPAIVSITIDDGFDDSPLAAQLLDKYGMKGTFYIISGVLNDSPYMSTSQVQAIRAAGHEIGGHTITHQHLTQMSAAEQQHEI